MEGQYRTIGELALAQLRLERVFQDGSGPFERAHQVDAPSLVYLRTAAAAPALGCLGTPTSHRSFAPFGTAVLVPAGVPLHVRSPGFSEREMIVLRFDPARFGALTGIDAASPVRELEACVDVRAGAVLAPLERLARECARPGIGTDAIVTGLGMVVLGELARHFASLRGRGDRRQGGLAAWQVARIERRLADAGAPIPDIDELSAICGIGRRHLMRAYKASSGTTVMARVERVRLDRAMQLLNGGDMPIKTIAGLCGFASQAGFATAFRRCTGRTPSDWRSWRRAVRTVTSPSS